MTSEMSVHSHLVLVCSGPVVRHITIITVCVCMFMCVCACYVFVFCIYVPVCCVVNVCLFALCEFACMAVCVSV